MENVLRLVDILLYASDRYLPAFHFAVFLILFSGFFEIPGNLENSERGIWKNRSEEET